MRCQYTSGSSHEEIWKDFHFDLELKKLASFRQSVSKFLFVIHSVAMKVLTRFQEVFSSYTNPQVFRQPETKLWDYRVVNKCHSRFGISSYKAPPEAFVRSACNLGGCQSWFPVIALWIGSASYGFLSRSSFTERHEGRGGSQVSTVFSRIPHTIAPLTRLCCFMHMCCRSLR